MLKATQRIKLIKISDAFDTVTGADNIDSRFFDARYEAEIAITG
jgi:hypothetical protein